MKEGPIRSLIEGPLNRGEENLLLKEVVQLNSWNWDRISFVIPPFLLQKVKATPFPLSAFGWIIFPSTLHQTVTLIVERRTGWLVWVLVPPNNRVQLKFKYRRSAHYQKLGASYGNAPVEVSLFDKSLL